MRAVSREPECGPLFRLDCSRVRLRAASRTETRERHAGAEEVRTAAFCRDELKRADALFRLQDDFPLRRLIRHSRPVGPVVLNPSRSGRNKFLERLQVVAFLDYRLSTTEL